MNSLIVIVDEDHSRSETYNATGTLELRRLATVKYIAAYYKANYPDYKGKLHLTNLSYSRKSIVVAFERAN